MSYVNTNILKKYLDTNYPNNFTVLDWTIDEQTMAPEMNYINNFTKEQLMIRIPSMVDLQTFVENYFLEVYTENRNQKLENILK
jgi:hypothetical protein